MNALKKAALFCALLLAPLAALAQTAVSGTRVVDNTGALLASGQWCFGVTCLTVTNGAFSGSVTAGTQTVTVTNGGATTYLTVPSVVIGASAFSWDSYVVPTGIALTGLGKPRIACAPGATYTQSDASAPLNAWSCSVNPTGQAIWTTSGGGIIALPPGNYAGAGAPTFTCTVPCTFIRTDTSVQYLLSGTSGSVGSSWITGGIGGLPIAGGATTGTSFPSGAPAGALGASLFYSPMQSLNLMAFGVKDDERDLYDCSVTASSTTLTCPDGNFTAADNARLFNVSMGTQGIAYATATVVTGATVTGTLGQNCTVTPTGGGGSGASGIIYLSGTNALSTGAPGGYIFFTSDIGSFGSGYTSAPTSATLTNGGPSNAGPATCSGSITITSVLLPNPVSTTATVASSTTMTMATPSTITNTGGVFASIYTDNTANTQSWLNALCSASQTTQGYVPSGSYGIKGNLTINCPLTILGDGVWANWGSGATFTTLYPESSPFLSGAVFVQEQPGADVFDITTAGAADNFARFGVRFAPPIAGWNTGHAFNATPTATSGGFPVWGQINYEWRDLDVWGVDGLHDAYLITNSQAGRLDNLSSWGGGGLKFYANTNLCCPGNTQMDQMVLSTFAGGTEHSESFTGASGTTFNNNLVKISRPNSGTYPLVAGGSSTPMFNWPIPPVNPSVQRPMFADNNQKTMYVSSPDWELYLGGGAIITPQRSDFICLGGGNCTIMQVTHISTPQGVGPLILSSAGGSPAIELESPVSGNTGMVGITASNTFPVGGTPYLWIGEANSAGNSTVVQNIWQGNNNANNVASISIFGNTNSDLALWNNGTSSLGIGSSTPPSGVITGGLQIAGNINVGSTSNTTSYAALFTNATSGVAGTVQVVNGLTINNTAVGALTITEPNLGAGASALAFTSIGIGNAGSANNCTLTAFADIGGSGSSSNFSDFGVCGATNRLTVSSAGNVGIGIGHAAATVPLQVGGLAQATAFDTPTTTVAALPSASSSSGNWRVVSDSTAVSAEGQTCVGGSSNVALAFSNGSAWKCF